MKKTVSLLLALAMLFVLFTAVQADDIRVGIALANADDFTETMRQNYENMAPDFGIKTIITNAGGDASNEISNVESLIAQRPDVIVLRCVDGEVGDTLVEMVVEAGIPCIIDETTPIHNRDYVVNIVGDQSVHGRLIGTYLQQYLDENPEETLYMLYINGGTSDNIRKRMNGIFETCTSDRLVQIGDELGSWSATTAAEKTEAYLTSHPEMNLIACANDEMALGVIETLKSAGKLDSTMVFGVDGSESGQAAIKAGDLTGTTLNDTRLSVNVIYESVLKIVAGEELVYTDAENKTIDPSAYVLLTAENIETEGTY